MDCGHHWMSQETAFKIMPGGKDHTETILTCERCRAIREIVLLNKKVLSDRIVSEGCQVPDPEGWLRGKPRTSGFYWHKSGVWTLGVVNVSVEKNWYTCPGEELPRSLDRLKGEWFGPITAPEYHLDLSKGAPFD